MQLSIECVVSHLFEENCWVVWKTPTEPVGSEGTPCVVVDPGFEPQKVLRSIQKNQLVPKAILLTHGHADHIAGVRVIKEFFPEAPIVIGVNEAELLTDPDLNLSALGGFPVTSPPADELVSHGESRTWAGLTFDVREIPGHSPGHVVFICRETDPVVVLGGDVLFAGSIGRTDFPGGSLGTLLKGIREHLFTLPETTRVYPGHGSMTTVGVERESNPFCGKRALPRV
jgi:hydroxyacylglutathione hydrolase